MKVSRQADYALRAMFTLAERYGRDPISIRELAEQNDAPKRFLEHIMLDLKAQGWVESTPGKRGGYRLAQAPDRVSMGQVVRHFDGLLAPINCVSSSHTMSRAARNQPAAFAECSLRSAMTWRAGWMAPRWRQ